MPVGKLSAIFRTLHESNIQFIVVGSVAAVLNGAPVHTYDVDLVYSRFNHPNAQILEDQIVPLEPGAVAAAVFNSGMAAIMTALLAVLQPGDAVIYTVPIYGGTQTLLQGFLQPFGIRGVPVRAVNVVTHARHM